LIRTPKQAGLNAGEAWMDDVEARIRNALESFETLGFLSKGGNLVVVTGWRGGSGYTNTMRIVKHE
jgi:pyruvate kinase